MDQVGSHNEKYRSGPNPTSITQSNDRFQVCYDLFPKEISINLQVSVHMSIYKTVQAISAFYCLQLKQSSRTNLIHSIGQVYIMRENYLNALYYLSDRVNYQTNGLQGPPLCMLLDNISSCLSIHASALFLGKILNQLQNCHLFYVKEKELILVLAVLRLQLMVAVSREAGTLQLNVLSAWLFIFISYSCQQLL